MFSLPVKNLILIYMLYLIGAPFSVHQKALADSENDLFDAVRMQVEQLVDKEAIPSLALAVAHNGKIIWEEGFGLADLENGIPATAYTPYKLASISKPLTATGLMVLKERGLVQLDKPANNYLGKVKIKARIGLTDNATVERVANHTSGLPLHSQHFYANEPNQPPPMDTTIHRYGNLVTAPGERYQYSNLGYGLLGYIISRLSGNPFASFMDEEVFKPLGMVHTSVYTGHGLGDRAAVNYTSDGVAIPPYTSDSPGASDITGSAHDLIRFAMFQLKNALPGQKAIISNATIDQMQRPSQETGPTREWEQDGSGYGIGWVVSIAGDHLRVIHHSGGTLGVSNVIALLPDENLAVVILSNVLSHWPETILIKIMGSIFPKKLNDFPQPAVQKAQEQPFAPGEQLAGKWTGYIYTYERKVPLELDIKRSGKVYITLDDQPPNIMEKVSYQKGPNRFKNSGGGVFLRGCINGDLKTANVKRGRPNKLWLEFKLRNEVLNGSLIVFSQRKLPTGPMTHWVELKRK